MRLRQHIDCIVHEPRSWLAEELSDLARTVQRLAGRLSDDVPASLFQAGAESARCFDLMTGRRVESEDFLQRLREEPDRDKQYAMVEAAVSKAGMAR